MGDNAKRITYKEQTKLAKKEDVCYASRYQDDTMLTI